MALNLIACLSYLLAAIPFTLANFDIYTHWTVPEQDFWYSLYGNTPRNCQDIEQTRRFREFEDNATANTMNVMTCLNPPMSADNPCIDGNPSHVLQMRVRVSAAPAFNWIFFPTLGSEDTPPAPNGGAWLRGPDSNATAGYYLPYPGDRQECQSTPSDGSAASTIQAERRFRCISEWTADDVNDPIGYMNRLGEGCRKEFVNGAEAYLACVKKPFKKFCEEAVKAESLQTHRRFCDEINGYKSWWKEEGGGWVQGNWTI